MVSSYYRSRLQSRKEQIAKRNTYLLLGGSAIVIILIAFFGIRAVFGLTGAITSITHKDGEIVSDEINFVPSQPRFAQDLIATKSGQITVKGFADPGVDVEISQNDRVLEVQTTDEEGMFTIEVDLERGENVFVATSVSGDNRSDASENYTIQYLTSPPKLEVSSPKDGDEYKESSVTLNGETDSEAIVTVNERLVIVNTSGKFSTIVNLNSGDNQIKVVATDLAGNQTTKEFKVKYSP